MIVHDKTRLIDQLPHFLFMRTLSDICSKVLEKTILKIREMGSNTVIIDTDQFQLSYRNYKIYIAEFFQQDAKLL